MSDCIWSVLDPRLKINMNPDIIRWVFKLVLAIWRSQPIKDRVRERQPMTERLQSFISLKSRLSYLFGEVWNHLYRTWQLELPNSQPLLDHHSWYPMEKFLWFPWNYFSDQTHFIFKNVSMPDVGTVLLCTYPIKSWKCFIEMYWSCFRKDAFHSCNILLWHSLCSIKSRLSRHRRWYRYFTK